MILVALHTGLEQGESQLQPALESIAEQHGETISYFNFSSPIDLEDRLVASGKMLVDIVVSPYELKGMTAIQAVQAARQDVPTLKVVVCAATGQHAAECARNGVDGYLVTPIDLGEFADVMSRIIGEVARLHSVSLAISTRVGMRCLPYSQIVYCETSGHDQVIHLYGKKTVGGRYSSQALYELFGGDERFFKAGSSFIINLDEVAIAHITSGTVTMKEGSVLNVPSRLRKSFEEALVNRGK